MIDWPTEFSAARANRETSASLARRLGVSRQAVHEAGKRYGVRMTPTLEDVHRALTAEGKTCAEAARALGCSRSWVSATARKLGLLEMVKERERQRRIDKAEARWQNLFAGALEAGWSRHDLATYLGNVRGGAVASYLGQITRAQKRYGLPELP